MKYTSLKLKKNLRVRQKQHRLSVPMNTGLAPLPPLEADEPEFASPPPLAFVAALADILPACLM